MSFGGRRTELFTVTYVRRRGSVSKRDRNPSKRLACWVFHCSPAFDIQRRFSCACVLITIDELNTAATAAFEIISHCGLSPGQLDSLPRNASSRRPIGFVECPIHWLRILAHRVLLFFKIADLPTSKLFPRTHRVAIFWLLSEEVSSRTARWSL